MNHRKAMLAKDRMFNAREMFFECVTTAAAGPSGLEGMETQISRWLVIVRREKRIPASAAARGVLMRC
jgi:hypothetical protein